jgi:hypothetical protein
MLIDTPSSVCGKHLSVLKETSYNPSLHFSLDDNPLALVGDSGLESGPAVSMTRIAESRKNVTEESVNQAPANVSKLEIAAFKRVMWQWQETNEVGAQNSSKAPKESTAGVVEYYSFPRLNEGNGSSVTKPLHCTCGHFSFHSEADLQKHKLEHHQVQWRCSASYILLENRSVARCGETFSKESEFREHMQGHGIWEKASQDQAVRDWLVQDKDLSVRFENHHEVELPPLPPKLELDLPLEESFLERRRRHEKNEYSLAWRLSKEPDDTDSLEKTNEDYDDEITRAQSR